MILDYINSNIKILWYIDPSLISRKGLILLETEKTFLVRLEGENKVIRIFKAHGIFEITFKGKSFIIGGYKLVRKPWKRI
ncbi:ribonuclease P [Sulfolobus sp. E5-1-F]|uniref:ribonuclease P protein subunit n=1 Tax=Saccharolobus sp. E5-1-F TaxID=2663019 RepID=UPI0012961507|nr:ribonuclease P protein subunit [Sulfolobus sp. E5-1-F]QGA54517.1 ribonuclease P [Sulfolobus sp. E5-1-F]